MRKKRTKVITLEVEVRVPDWMTATQAKREVRTLINHQSYFMSHGPDLQDVEVRAERLRRAVPADATAAYMMNQALGGEGK